MDLVRWVISLFGIIIFFWDLMIEKYKTCIARRSKPEQPMIQQDSTAKKMNELRTLTRSRSPSPAATQRFLLDMMMVMVGCQD